VLERIEPVPGINHGDADRIGRPLEHDFNGSFIIDRAVLDDVADGLIEAQLAAVTSLGGEAGM
jgi:hypothetical protein